MNARSSRIHGVRHAPPKDKTLNDLFLDTLKDIYYAEKQILKALPKMAKAATSDKLRAAFEKHHGETEGQIERLEQVFELLDKPARGKTCDAIMGILDEGKEIMDEYKGTEALDAGLLAAAQAVEHYEISRYGTLKQWATQLGMKDAAKLLDQTLQEEKKTDVSADHAGRDRGEPRRGGVSHEAMVACAPHCLLRVRSCLHASCSGLDPGIHAQSCRCR